MTIPDLSSRALAARTALLALCDALVSAADASHAGLAVPPPATAGEDRSRGCVVAFCADHAEVEVVTGPFCPVCSMGKVLDDGVRLGRTAKWPTTPAPEAKRPTHVRITGPKGQLSVTIGKVYEVLYFDASRDRLIIKNDDGVEWGLSNKPDEGPAFPTWAPAPCPPPVAGRGEVLTRPARAARFAAWYRAHVERDPGRYHSDANEWCAGNGDLVDAAQTAWLAYEAGFDDASLSRPVRP